MLFSSKGSTTPGEISVLFDVGSGSIAGAVVRTSGRIPEILYRYAKPIPFQEDLDSKRFAQATLTTLTTVAAEVSKQQANILSVSGERRRGIVLVTLSSPWYLSKTKMVHIAQEKSFTVSKRMLKDLAHQEVAQFEEATERDERDHKLIECGIIETRLNGYATAQPHDKRTRSLSAAVYMSHIPLELYQSMTDALEKVFPQQETIFHTFTLASFFSLRELFSSEKNFLLMDVRAEVTDMSLIRDGVLMATVSFPKGKNSIVRSVLPQLANSPEEAQSLVTLGLSGKSTDPKVMSALERAQRDWLTDMQSALAALTEHYSLPSKIFLTAEGDVADWFTAVIKKDAFTQLTFTTDPFIVTVLGRKLLATASTFKDPGVFDPFLSLEAVFLRELILEE